MKNRYGEEYEFKKLSASHYVLVQDFKYIRCGGKEKQEEIEYDDLGFIDPEGGPYVAVGSMVDGKEVIKISWLLGKDINFFVKEIKMRYNEELAHFLSKQIIEEFDNLTRNSVSTTEMEKFILEFLDKRNPA